MMPDHLAARLVDKLREIVNSNLVASEYEEALKKRVVNREILYVDSDVLWERAEDIHEVVDLEIADLFPRISHAYNQFQGSDWDRVAAADLSYPILVLEQAIYAAIYWYSAEPMPDWLCAKYIIRDGHHRVVKAVIHGQTTIKAKILPIEFFYDT